MAYLKLHPSPSLQLIHFLLGTDVFICLLFFRALIYLRLFENKFYLSVVEHAFNSSTGGKLISMSLRKASLHSNTLLQNKEMKVSSKIKVSFCLFVWCVCVPLFK